MRVEARAFFREVFLFEYGAEVAGLSGASFRALKSVLFLTEERFFVAVDRLA